MIRALLVLVLFLWGCAAQIELVEPEIRTNILGTWLYGENVPPSYTAQRFTFKADGSGKFISYGGCLVFDEAGKWIVSGDTLQIKITTESKFQAKRDETYKVILLTPSKMKLKDTRDGQVLIFKRVKS